MTIKCCTDNGTTLILRICISSLYMQSKCIKIVNEMTHELLYLELEPTTYN